MLEQVGEAGAPLRLGTEADVDVHRDPDDRRVGSGRTSTRRPLGKVARWSWVTLPTLRGGREHDELAQRQVQVGDRVRADRACGRR